MSQKLWQFCSTCQPPCNVSPPLAMQARRVRRRPFGLLLLLLPCARAPTVCDYQVDDIISFNFMNELEIERGALKYDVSMASINIGFGASGVSSIDGAC